MKIAVIGSGYVGLVTGAGFSDFGHDVTCVDIDAGRVDMLRRGEVPIVEPGLTELVRRNASLGRLAFTTSVGEAVAGARIAIIAVGTPPAPDGSADLADVDAAAEAIGRAITDFTVVVMKSTVPVGTCDRIRAAIARVTAVPFAVASNPELMSAGRAVADFMSPSRVIVGADDDRAIELLRDLYGPILRTSNRMEVMDVRSAELAKYAANAMLATRISFMNELARLADAVGADIEAVRRAIGSDPRIGRSYLFAGAGFGGSCLPKDIRALVAMAGEHDVELGIVAATARANTRQTRAIGDRLAAHFAGELRGRRIAIWGLAFKPNTDDIRESAALVLVDQLLRAGATVVGYDPAASANVRAQLGDAIELASGPYEAAWHADALALVTEWHELRHPDFARLATAMRGRVLVDGRNVWTANAARAAGFTYYGIGRS